MRTVDDTVKIEVLRLVSVTVVPSGGAGFDKVTVRGAVCPGATTTFVPRAIPPRFTTSKLAVPLT
jgi:hypothetical protein